MKLVLISVVALLVLGGGGFAAWWFLLSDGEMSEMAEEVLPDPNPEFVKLRPFVIPVMVDGEVTHRVTVKLYLDLLPEYKARTLKHEMPRIRNSIIGELHSLYAMRYVRELENSLPLIKQRVGQAVDQAFGTKVVGAVLIGDLHARRILKVDRNQLPDTIGDGRSPRRLTPTSP